MEKHAQPARVVYCLYRLPLLASLTTVFLTVHLICLSWLVQQGHTKLSVDKVSPTTLYHEQKILQSFKNTRDVFYVRTKVDLMKTAKVNAYIMHIFGNIELLSIHAT